MREIKFRAWDGQCMAEVTVWTSDDALQVRDQGSEIGTRIMQRENCSALMQFTGLKDKNGKEIYEGDILRESDELVFAVEYDSENGMYTMPNEYDPSTYLPSARYRRTSKSSATSTRTPSC
jgi:uncharacterized phage protein (TIGR01671 family)